MARATQFSAPMGHIEQGFSPRRVVAGTREYPVEVGFRILLIELLWVFR
jgi:hypothetical protein